MDEREITRILQLDLSVGTDAFRDRLLERCLAVLSEREKIADLDEGAELDDSELELLAAAGDPNSLFMNPENL